MEQIVIEVGDATAKRWRLASDRYKKVMSAQFAKDIDFVTETYKNKNFFESLDEIGERLAKRGITEEIVNQILKSDI